jgi:hypothetical protein
VTLAGLGIWTSRGLPQRFSKEVQASVSDSIPRPVPGAEPCYSTGGFPPKPCSLGPAGAPLLATFLGDSHADAQLLALVEAIPAGARGRVEFNALAGCPPVIDVQPAHSRSRCGAFNARFLAPLTKPRRVPLVLSASWAGYSRKPAFRSSGEEGGGRGQASFHSKLLRSSCALASGGPTYIVLPTPHFPYWVSRELQRRLIADPKAPDLAIPFAAHERRNREVVAVLREAERRCGVRLLDPAPYLCRSGVCPGSLGRRPLYRDDHHLTDGGARLLVPMFRSVFADRTGGGGG